MKRTSTINKKGAISSTIADFWAYVGFVFVVVAFYTFFTYQAKDVEANKIKGIQTEVSNDLNLLNYLRTPYTLDGNQITMVDMIALYSNEKNDEKRKLYFEGISKRTRELLDPLETCMVQEGGTSRYLLGYAVYIVEGEILIKVDKRFGSEHFFDDLVRDKSFVFIPNNEGDTIKVGFMVSYAKDFGEETNNVRGCK